MPVLVSATYKCVHCSSLLNFYLTSILLSYLILASLHIVVPICIVDPDARLLEAENIYADRNQLAWITFTTPYIARASSIVIPGLFFGGGVTERVSVTIYPVHLAFWGVKSGKAGLAQTHATTRHCYTTGQCRAVQAILAMLPCSLL